VVSNGNKYPGNTNFTISGLTPGIVYTITIQSGTGQITYEPYGTILSFTTLVFIENLFCCFPLFIGFKKISRFQHQYQLQLQLQRQRLQLHLQSPQLTHRAKHYPAIRAIHLLALLQVE